MAKPTYEQFSYALRPAKNTERKMLCEALSRLHRLQSLNRYKYVGFGSLTFVDFQLMHKRLGINDLTSIEIREDHKDRFDFNKPFPFIDLKWGHSSQVLPEVSLAKKRCIIWLDYDSHLDKSVIDDVSKVSARLRSGSVLIVTVTADAGGGSDPMKAPQKRYDKLRHRVGNDQVPIDISKKDLANWGLARVSRRIIETNIMDVLDDRSGVLPSERKLEYQQLFNFQYADGTKMLTTGGVILNSRDREKLGKQQWESLPFIRHDGDPFRIETPVLTLRETSHLDQIIASKRSLSDNAKWLPREERNRYKEVYRYSPTYVEAEF